MKSLAFFLFLLAACTPAAMPKAAPSSTAISTVTSTPVPPLLAHEWSQSEPLIIFDRGMSPLSFWSFWSKAYPVDFTLLPSGDLYLFKGRDGHQTILTTRLSRQAVCNLLNSVDQAGYFDYDPSSYGHPRSLDAPTTRISVNAWRANSVSLYALTWLLPGAMEGEVSGDTAILPAIRDTYRLLDQYQAPGALRALKPERLGVWLLNEPVGYDYIEWPLKSHPLEAAPVSRREPGMILTGADAAQVYDVLGRSAWLGSFREGDNVYPDKAHQFQAFVRPLLPNEFNSSPLPTVSLSCAPSDGWIRMP